MTYNFVDCQLESPSLAANLLDDPGILQFSVLTPIDYDTSGVRYPTLYYLMGGAVDSNPAPQFAQEIAFLSRSSSLPEDSDRKSVV